VKFGGGSVQAAVIALVESSVSCSLLNAHDTAGAVAPQKMLHKHFGEVAQHFAASLTASRFNKAAKWSCATIQSGAASIGAEFAGEIV
jgi:hypothetical protein